MGLFNYRRLTDKTLIRDLVETYMYDKIEVHISPTDDHLINENNVVYKTSDYDISKQIEIIKKFLHQSNIHHIKNTLYVNVVMSGYSEGNMCDTYIFFIKMKPDPERMIRNWKNTRH